MDSLHSKGVYRFPDEVVVLSSRVLSISCVRWTIAVGGDDGFDGGCLPIGIVERLRLVLGS